MKIGTILILVGAVLALYGDSAPNSTRWLVAGAALVITGLYATGRSCIQQPDSSH